MADRNTIINQILAAQELSRRQSRKLFKKFIRHIKPGYDMQWFHAVAADKLQQFAEGKIKKLMILMPPQHGKTELATKLFSAFMLGLDPDKKIAIAAYAQTVASGFNRAIQRYMDNEEYGILFPDTKLNYSQTFLTNVDGYSRTDKNVEIVNKLGGIRTVGRGGPLTSQPVDIGIIDDLYKDRAEASSPNISESAWLWYTDVFLTRLHNDSQQLIMNTRWDDLDLAGRLLIQEPGEWEILLFTGIRTEDEYPYDIREVGEALWPNKHSLERLLKIQKDSEITFNSLYQQNPKGSSKLLVYPEVFEVPEFPKHLDRKFWGLDFGFTNGKTVLVKCGDDPVGNYFDECCYVPGISMKGIKEILYAEGYVSGEVVWCDHVPDNYNELRLLGINAIPANKGPGSVQAGILKMKEKKIFITARSVNGRREASNYRWKAFANIITNEPEKGWDHFWDAARYGKHSDSLSRREV